jgi:1-acyl-sn-glycerol-3-phosphate acyltransferase
VGRLLFPPAALVAQGLLSLWARFRITNLSEVRRTFQQLAKKPGGLLICANHLTYVDSAVVIWALAPLWWYTINYKKVPWNLPAADHFNKGILYPVLAFIFKCIFVDRQGSKAHKKAVLGTVLELLERGESVVIFPEGRRSRSGRFERESSRNGVGRLLSALDSPTVLCLYLRDKRQATYSKFPPRRSRFSIGVSMLHPKGTSAGTAGHRELTLQVVDELVRLEEAHFARENIRLHSK